MTLALVLNIVFMTLLLTLLAATMRLPVRLPSGDRVQVQVRARQRRAVHARRAETAPRRVPRGAEGSFATD